MPTYHHQVSNGYQYQNIPSSEQQHNDSIDTDNHTDGIPDQHGSYAIGDPQEVQQQQQQNNNYQQQYTHVPSSYRMPSYQDYIQNINAYDTNNQQTGIDFGTYGSNHNGFLDWSYYRRQSKMNRIFLFVAAGLFLLFLISHPAAQSSTATESNGDRTQKLKGVAGDEPSLPPVGPSVVPSNDNAASSHAVTNHINTAGDDAPDDQNDATTLLSNLNISYLLAYPMSGSTFTMYLVSITTNTTLGTNYDYNAFLNESRHPIPILSTSQDTRTDGTIMIGSPFWYETYPSTNKPIHNVLTLSQCGGYCMYPCTPDNYILTESIFEETCRTVIEQSQPPGTIYASITPKSKVTKVVHLIRDPFSNVVSRFHDYLRDKAAKHELSMMYPNTVEGFRSWCNEMDKDENLIRLELESPLISLQVKEWMKSVPCHGEFYKYVSWHNHVVEMVWNEEYPYLQIYYEDFSTSEKQHEVAVKVAEFMEEPVVSNNYSLPEFLVIRLYSDFFTESERQNIEKFIRMVAYKKVMVMLERYFSATSAVAMNGEQ